MCRILYGHGWARLPPGHPLIFADVPWALQTHMRRGLQANLSTSATRTAPYVYTVSELTVPDRAVRYRTLPCRPAPYRTAPGRLVRYWTVPTAPSRTYRTVPHRTAYMYRTRPCPTASCAPYRTCRTCNSRTVPCCAVMHRTGPDRTAQCHRYRRRPCRTVSTVPFRTTPDRTVCTAPEHRL